MMCRAGRTKLCTWAGASGARWRTFSILPSKSPGVFFGNCRVHVNKASVPSENGYLITAGPNCRSSFSPHRRASALSGTGLVITALSSGGTRGRMHFTGSQREREEMMGVLTGVRVTEGHSCQQKTELRERREWTGAPQLLSS